MTLIVGEGVGKSYGANDVLKDLAFQVGPEDRIGLIGPNGAGKTTLLKILGGLETQTVGTVRVKKGMRAGYLPQTPPPVGEQTLWQSMLDVFAELRATEAAIHELTGQLGSGADAGLLKRLGELQHQFEAGGGYRYTKRIEIVLSGLGLGPERSHLPLAQLSGGQRTRALLGRLLLEEPEILLLDEPTNHLDLATVEWLEEFLQSFRGCLVVVSHDRHFLNKLATAIWEVEFGRLETYAGNYTAYTQQKHVRQTETMRRWESQQQYVEKTEEYVRRFIAGQRARQAKGRRTRLERFKEQEAMDRPQERQEIHLNLKAVARSGDLIVRAKDLAVGYEAGKTLVSAEHLEVRRLDRVAILGGNGVGKTTLLRTLMGELPPLAGTVKIGAAVHVGHLSQTHSDLKPEWTVLEAILDADEDLKPPEARKLVASLLFSGDDAFKTISQLSGGQRSRVVLGRLRAVGANVLMLDEPTNHLDLASRDLLQDVLKEFEGTVLFVSHDRYLVQALATCVWAIEDRVVHCIQGNWDAYVKWRTARQAQAAAEAAPAVERAAPKRGSAVHEESRRQKRQLERLRKRHGEIEEEIHKLEGRLRELTEGINLASQSGDVEKVRELGREYEEVNPKLSSLWEEWERVGEELEAGEQ